MRIVCASLHALANRACPRARIVTCPVVTIVRMTNVIAVVTRFAVANRSPVRLSP